MAAIGGLSGSSWAESLVVVNPSFEETPSYTLGEDQHTAGCGTIVQVLDPEPPYDTGIYVETVGWVSLGDDPTRGGVLNPGTTSYPDGPPDGQNVAWSEPAPISQILSTTLAPSTRYTLGVYVGNRVIQPESQYEISLWAGGALLVAQTGELPTEGTFEEVTVVYVSPLDVMEKQQLEIRLQSVGSLPDHVNFDSISLDATAICDGDANGDGTVDPLDSGYVQARFGCEAGAGDSNCDAADVNADDAVDPLDVGYVLARFGNCE